MEFYPALTFEAAQSMTFTERDVLLLYRNESIKAQNKAAKG